MTWRPCCRRCCAKAYKPSEPPRPRPAKGGAAVDTPAVFQVEPLDATPVSLARREWSTEPEVRIRHYTDLYGNPCTRVMLPAGCSTLRFGASALVPVD